MEAYYYWAGFAVAGALLGWLLASIISRSKWRRVGCERDRAKEELSDLQLHVARLEDRFEAASARLENAHSALEREREKLFSQSVDLGTAREKNRLLEIALDEQKRETMGLQKKLTADFENLANRILEEKSKVFAVQNRESLDRLLVPLGEKIGSFRDRVEQSRESDIKDRASLVAELNSLKELNSRMSQEARNLTTALKGQAKTQGNWGEQILERVLQSSGLVEGQDYESQVSINDDAGRRFQPDVLINLPDNKRIVIDSKVSLVAYERYVNTDKPEDRDRFLKAHLESIKSHISDLGGKSYESLPGVDSLDFTLMFVPVEPALSAATVADDSLFDFAYRQNVALVSPSTLLVALRACSQIKGFHLSHKSNQ